MGLIDTVCVYIANIVPLLFSVSAFCYGVANFFKKGKALYLQLITLGIGCYALGSFYHLCQTLTGSVVVEGFTAAYLGRMGFFLFLFTANFGQINGIVDDRTSKMAYARRIAFLAPLAVALLYVPCMLANVSLATKISIGLVWICAMPSTYFNLKHALIKDDGFGFVKAIRPYNISALLLSFAELIFIVLWVCPQSTYMFIALATISVIFGILGVVTVTKLKKGVEAWII